jgi:phage terminase large subunit GpA-like protein
MTAAIALLHNDTPADRRARVLAARAVRTRLVLPPVVTGSEWADQKRYLSPPAAQAGPWVTDRVPFLREIQDVICGREYSDITIVKSSQTGGTEAINNGCGFYMDQEPSSILVIQPNVKPMAEDWSKDRLAPMLRDTVCLRNKVKDPRARDSGNTILHKTYPGGQLTVIGANSPAGLASRPIRIVFADELDRWPDSAGSEGDPLSLAEARTITFRHRKKIVKVSTPGNEGESRIEKEWAKSDQRHYYVPCPYCGHAQPLEWRDTDGKPNIKAGRGAPRVIWEKGVAENGEHTHLTDTARYQCRACDGLIDDTQKPAMLAAGQWIKHNPESKRAGFHIAGLLSPWVRFTEIAAEWIAKKDAPEERKTFFNTKLGLLYSESGEVPDATALEARKEVYNAEVPMAVGLLTASVDRQKDRIEVEVRGWGADEESWQIHLERLVGDPNVIAGTPDQPSVWELLDTLLLRGWKHEGGAEMRVAACMVDASYETESVFAYVRPRQSRNVFAVFGRDQVKDPITRARRPNRHGVKPFTINPNTFKDTLFARLRREHVGKGYLHFGTRTGADPEYYRQFGAEKRVVEFDGQKIVVSYVNPMKKRNEAIDLYVYNLAALRSLGMTLSSTLGRRAAAMQRKGAEMQQGGAEEPRTDALTEQDVPMVKPSPKRQWLPRSGSGFVKRPLR